jgi:hypothetical protein
MTGYKLVPIEPTEEMDSAGAEYIALALEQGVLASPADVFVAMLQVSPAPSPEVVDELIERFLDKWHGPATTPTGIAIRAVVKDGIRAFLTAIQGESHG